MVGVARIGSGRAHNKCYQSMYVGATTSVKVNGNESTAFEVKVGSAPRISAQSSVVHHRVRGIIE